ncbi:MAG: class A beta-lactamase-related serine hydrolase [Pedobacter sp.]|nr:MAG: class A beta-lactamase-related serine hydrolase [Pedobacter sp.]
MKTRFLASLICCTLFWTAKAQDMPSGKETDLKHFKNIENNLVPVYSIKGQTKRMSISDFLKRDEIPGLRIVFIDKGKIAWSADYGYADIEKKIKVNANTVFAGASLAKPVAAVTALSLVEKGKLDLDENINERLIGWKVPENEFTKIQKVTLRRLLSHTSGLDGQLWSEYLEKDSVPTFEQMLNGEKPSVDPVPHFFKEPGKAQKYSNTGYLVAGELIADVSGQSFADAVDKLVFRPAGMTNSTFRQLFPVQLRSRAATGYSGNLRPFPYKIYPFGAAGAIWTTPNDLGKFVITLLKDYKTGSHNILSQEMSKNVFNKGEEKDRLGFSLWTYKDDIVFRHMGHCLGFTSFIFGSVDKDQAVIVMSNGENTQDLFDHVQRAVAEEYKWDYFRPEFYDAATIDIRSLKQFAGQFDWEGNFLMITKEDDKLFVLINSDRYQLIPIAENQFLIPEKYLKLIFPKGEAKSIEIWKANGDSSRANKTN